MANTVAIVGRPNVGKSTFFNRIVGQRKAIMDNVSGVTRDRHYGFAEWCGKNFILIDTGGYVVGSDDIFESEIRKQVQLAIQEADVILFMVDVDEGITDLDKDFANFVRKSKKPILIVANKSDTPLKAHLSGAFYGLGISDEIFPVSSQTGSGTGDLLDRVISFFSEEDLIDPHEGLPRIAILGRPNVGKSSLLNVLLGTNRSIVTDVAGTTRDAIDTIYNAYGKKFVITDTAGIRKKSSAMDDIEFYSVMRSIQAMEHADVCICMIDATRGIEAQDVNIISLAIKNKKGIVLVVNKWDLIEDKASNTTIKWQENIYYKLAPANFMPIIFTSVTQKQRIHKILEVALQVNENKNEKIPTSKLNEVLLPFIENYPPPALNGLYVKIKYITQLPTKNPTFAFFCNKPKYIKENYVRFLENKIRQNFGFVGVPITLVFREK